MTDELVKYIQKNRKIGHTEGAIRESLRSVGYTSSMIAEAFDAAGASSNNRFSFLSNISIARSKPKEKSSSNPFDFKDMPLVNFFNNKRVILPVITLTILILAGMFAFESPFVKNGFVSVAGNLVSAADKVATIFSFEGKGCGTDLNIMMLGGSEKVCYINGTTGVGIQFMLHNRNNMTIDSVNVIVQGSKKESRFSIGGPISGGDILAKVITYDVDEFGEIGHTEIIPVVGSDPCYTESLEMIKMKECTI